MGASPGGVPIVPSLNGSEAVFAEPGLSHALAAQLQQLLGLTVASLYRCSEALGCAAHQSVGTLASSMPCCSRSSGRPG